MKTKVLLDLYYILNIQYEKFQKQLNFKDYSEELTIVINKLREMTIENNNYSLKRLENDIIYYAKEIGQTNPFLKTLIINKIQQAEV